MAEDLCRKAGFMLLKSANTKEFLELIKTYPDVTADAVDSLLKTIKFNEKKEVNTMDKRKCSVYGYIHEGGQAPEACPVYKHPQAYFEVRKENY